MPSPIDSWSIRLVRSDRDISIGFWGDIFFTTWKGDGNIQTVKYVCDNLMEFSLSKKDMIGMISIIQHNASFPPNESRKLMSETLKNINAVAFGAILEGKGFRASAVLGFAAGLMLISKTPYPSKVFSSPKECCVWFSETIKKRGGWYDLKADKLEKAIFDFMEIV